ncbi:MAG: undecaprenyl-diphosphate phosphatase [Defluviitaleaceae bacterium]|nr:undecaprenyl-diphosphate phosphatase [Defluviitaleaceae bacterium]
MNILEAIILGIVQGIAEFLPISSSGHLILMQNVLGISIDEAHLFTFDIVVHLGSLVAILVVFWSDIWKLIKNPFCKMTALLAIGTVPAVISGLFLQDIIVSYLRSGIWLAAAFTVTGFLMLLADSFPQGTKSEDDISYLDALFVGLCQALALPPGISRSGTTITGALSRKINREAAARYSFLLAIIAIGGAGLLDGIKFVRGGGAALETIGAVPLLIGFITSLVVGFLSIKLLLQLIKACKLKYFAYYLWVLAGIITVDYFILKIIF